VYTIQDPIFGKLERQGSIWVGTVWIEHFQQDIELELEYRDKNSPSKEEQNAFSEFQENLKSNGVGIEQAVFHYLQESVHLFEDVELPQQVNAVWSIVKPIRVWINSGNYEKTCVTLVCEFIWDEEHGLDIDFLGKQIGIAEGGCHWSDKAHYTLLGEPIHKEKKLFRPLEFLNHIS
jgi:hypothetical protein